MDDDFKFRHVRKVPWVIAAIYTAVLTLAFKHFPAASYFGDFLRLFIFGLGWWFGFQSFDEIASRYRRKQIFRDPDLKREFIRQQVSEWEEEANENRE